MRTLVLFSVFVFSACGPNLEPTGPRFPIEFFVSAGLNDELSAFQISLVTNGSALDCVTVQKNCIKDQVAADRFVQLKGDDGQLHPSRTFQLNLTSGAPSSQDLSLTEVPLGKNFALVVEAISKDTPPQLAGSSCNYIRELTSGTNAAVTARIEKLSPSAACDPRH